MMRAILLRSADSFFSASSALCDRNFAFDVLSPRMIRNETF
jgi:hypothetical protein